MKNRTRPSLLILLSLLLATFLPLALPVGAQQEFTAASFPGASSREDPFLDSKVEPGLPPAVTNDRLFYALPNFLTVESSRKLEPLAPQQKFKLVAQNSFDLAEIPWYAFRASISQAQNKESQLGPGAAGFVKRYGLTFADCTVENFMTGAILPSLLHQDPRFYRSGQGRIWRRAGYAASRTFITRADSGREEFNFSEIFGGAMAAGISTYAYHPVQDRTLRNTATGYGAQVAFHTLTIVSKEFWPDLRQKIAAHREARKH